MNPPRPHGDSSPRPPASRSRRSNGCVTCRLRKVKCDGRSGGCRNCENLDFRCSFSLPLSDLPQLLDGPLQRADGVPRRRIRQACKACHSTKVKCTAETPTCRRCRIKGLPCEYGPNRRGVDQYLIGTTGVSSPNPSGAQEPNAPEDSEDDTAMAGGSFPAPVRETTPAGQDPSPGRVSLEVYIDAFFHHVWPIAPFNFIHKGSLMRTWHRDRLSPTLLRTLAVLGSRFVAQDTRTSHALPSTWRDDLEKEVVQNLGTISLPKLQIILLLIYDRIASGQHTHAWYLSSLAVRIAYGLRLNHPTDSIPWVNQECRRRMMWCTYIIDKMTAHIGPGYPPLCARESMHITLPCDGQSFDLESSCSTPTLIELDAGQASSNLGVSGWLVRIHDLRDHVRCYVLGPGNDSNQNAIPPWNPCSDFQKLKQKLVSFAEALPLDLRDTERALFIRANTNSQECTGWMMIHTYLYLCHVELLRHFISQFATVVSPGDETSVDFLGRCKSELTQVLMLLTRIWGNVKKQMKQPYFTDWQLGQCVLDHCCALLEMASYSTISSMEDEQVAAGLQVDVDILRAMATVSPYIGRLYREAFQMIRSTDFHHSIALLDPKLSDNFPKASLEDVLSSVRRREDERWPCKEAERQNASPVFVETTNPVQNTQHLFEVEDDLNMYDQMFSFGLEDLCGEELGEQWPWG